MLGEFFGSIYCSLFEDFFGLNLADYMWGDASPHQQTVMFIGIGLWMLGVSAALVLIFYYSPLSPVRRVKLWWWITLALNAIINFIVGWQRVLMDYNEDMMVDVNGHELNIKPSDIVAFGVTNAILAVVTFIVISVLIKWWSRNASRAPF